METSVSSLFSFSLQALELNKNTQSAISLDTEAMSIKTAQLVLTTVKQ